MSFWVPTNYKSKSASKDRDGEFKPFMKKKKGSKSMAESIKGIKEIKKLK